MTRESALAFVERVKSDEDFRTKLAEAPDDDARRSIISSEGFSLSADDRSTIEGELGSEMELSDAELEDVQGGTLVTVAVVAAIAAQ